MRAVWVGLVGMVLAVGGVEARTCPIERTVYQVVDPGYRLYGMKIERPDLVGAKFRVVRQASSFWSTDEGFSEPTTSATLSLLIEGTKGRLIVEQQVVNHSSPSVTAMSWPASGPEKKPTWGRRDRAKEKRFFDGLPEIDVLSGPLSSLQLKPVACR